MKVFVVPRPTAADSTPSFRNRIATHVRRTADRIAELNARIDDAHARRDHANHHNDTVDAGFWIFLR